MFYQRKSKWEIITRTYVDQDGKWDSEAFYVDASGETHLFTPEPDLTLSEKVNTVTEKALYTFLGKDVKPKSNRDKLPGYTNMAMIIAITFIISAIILKGSPSQGKENNLSAPPAALHSQSTNESPQEKAEKDIRTEIKLFAVAQSGYIKLFDKTGTISELREEFNYSPSPVIGLTLEEEDFVQILTLTHKGWPEGECVAKMSYEQIHLAADPPPQAPTPYVFVCKPK